MLKMNRLIPSQTRLRHLSVFLALVLLPGCIVAETAYDIVAGTVKGAYYLTTGTVKAVYHVGKFTFEVVQAPFDWPLTHDEIETIDGLPVKEAIRQGRVKWAPYVVKGRRYVPMSIRQAQRYEEKGIASWYGEETRRKKRRAYDCKRRSVQSHGLDRRAQISAVADQRQGDEPGKRAVDCRPGQ